MGQVAAARISWRGRVAIIAAAFGVALAMMPSAQAEPWNWRDPDVTEKYHPPERDAIGFFPIATDSPLLYSNTFLARRGGGRPHLGVDIMAYGRRGDPVVAFDDGVVSWLPDNCCSLHITHDDGWSTRYIHLNDDRQDEEGNYIHGDDQGWGIAPGIERGTRVAAGQLIGWVGDSGNATEGVTHLHWEIIDPEGRWHDPTVYVDRAVKLSAPIPDDPEEGERPCAEESVCDSVGFISAGGEWSLWDPLSAETTMSDFYYGNPGDVAFMGDWNGDGTATPGLYRQSDGFVYLRNSNDQGVADITFFFGNPGDYPLVGDFDGDGDDTVSIWRQSQAAVYVVNELGEDGGGLGAAEDSFLFGNPGDNPFVGDFDGDTIDTVGLHRSATGFVYFRNSLTSGNADLSFFYGNPGDVILAGDWDGDGDDTVAVYRPSSSRVYVNLENTSGAADYSLYVGRFATAVTWGRQAD